MGCAGLYPYIAYIPYMAPRLYTPYLAYIPYMGLYRGYRPEYRAI